MKCNSSNLPRPMANAKKYANPKLGIVFIVLIILQFYLSEFISKAIGLDFASYTRFYTISSYTIIVLSIVIFNSSGLDVFRDHFSLWAIVLGCFLSVFFEAENATIYKGTMALLGIALSVYIITNQKSIKLPDLKTVFIGMLWSVGTLAIIGLASALLNRTYAKPIPSNLLNVLSYGFLFQFSFVV